MVIARDSVTCINKISQIDSTLSIDFLFFKLQILRIYEYICGLKLAKDWMRRDVYLCLPIAASDVVNHTSFDLFCS